MKFLPGSARALAAKRRGNQKGGRLTARKVVAPVALRGTTFIGGNMAQRSTVHFTPPDPVHSAAVRSSAPAPRPRDAEAAAEPDSNVLLCYADLYRDCKTVDEKVRALLSDRAGFHGNCQVILSMLRQMERQIERIILYQESI